MQPSEGDQPLREPGESGEPDADSLRDESGSDKLKRRVGCIWGCLTEPLFILGATFLAAILGRAYLVRRARRLRQHARDEDRKDK